MNSEESLHDQSDDLLASTSISTLDLFIRDLDERKGKIPCCQEVIDIQTSVENVLKSLLLEVEKENPVLKTTLINSGSFYEGTKVGQPDEFDYFVQLDYFSEPEAILFDELPRSTVNVIPSERGVRKLLKLTPSYFQRYFGLTDGFDWKTCVKAPFVDILNDKAKGFEAYGMKVLAEDDDDAGKVLERHGPAYCLELEWAGGERYRGLKISVDLSLAVKINFRSSTMDLNLETPAGKVLKSSLDSLPYYFAVSAYRDREFEVSPGCADGADGFRLRCSHSCLEQALFRHFGPDSGPSVCLRVLKVLRDISVPNESDDNTSQESEDDFKSIVTPLRNVLSFDPWSLMFDVFIRVSPYTREHNLYSKWLSSYVLKTLVLFEWEQNPEDDQWNGSNLSERFLNILNNLLLCLKQGWLRSFFYNDYNVLPNKDVNNLKIYAINRITILHQWILSIRDASNYRFEDCLENILQELKLSCQKMTLKYLLCLGLEYYFHQELNQVITRTTEQQDSMPFIPKFIFCGIYIQDFVDKIAPEEKLILLDLKSLKGPVSWRKATELFKNIAGTRMKGLENLPSYDLWSQEFKSAGTEIVKLLEFLLNIFKEDIETLLNELSNLNRQEPPVS